MIDPPDYSLLLSIDRQTDRQTDRTAMRELSGTYEVEWCW